MNKQEIIEKVQELMKDDQFKAKLANAESLDGMAALFQEEGIQVTGADLEAAIANHSDEEELSEEKLDNVSGGLIGGLIAAGCIIFAGGSLLMGYIDGVNKKAKSCKWY